MRVMWVVGRVPAPFARARGSADGIRGGWLDAMLERLRREPGIDLLVAFPGPETGAREVVDGVEFECLGSAESAGRVGRVAGRWAAAGPDPALLERCASLAASWRPDLVHVHGTESGLGLVATSLSPPVMLSVHGLLSAIQPLAYGAGRRRVVARATPWEFARGLSSWHEVRDLRSAVEIEQRLLRAVDHVAGRTGFDRRVTSVLAPQAVYHHVGELMRDPFYRHVRDRLDDRAPGPTTLQVGGWSPYAKGVDTALEAVKLLCDLHIRVELRVVGAEEDSAARRSTRSYAEALGVTDAVTYTGPVDAEGTVAGLMTADVYLQPSRVDNSPNSLCEAMMLGVPCVASTAGGIPSLATDGEDALLVPPGDAYSLAGAIKALIEDRVLAGRLSAAGRARALARHDPEAVTGGLVAVYEEIVRASRERARH